MDDQHWMRQCILLARKGIGRVSPNPAVGAVLVNGGKMVSSGFHKRFGANHAEVECVKNHDGDLRKATLYVNLEPCAHHGKTPPCTDMILEAGIGRVVVGMVDPNPLVSGKGIDMLRARGVEVLVGVCENACRELNRPFALNQKHGRAFVHLKLALSIDGKLSGGSKWISSLGSRRQVHRWRSTHDAILVGAGTMIEDNPGLDVRHVRGRDPHVVIVDGRLRVSPKARVFSAVSGRRIILCTSHKSLRKDPDRVQQLMAAGAEVLAFDAHRDRLSLSTLCRALLHENIGSILVEGGQDISAGFIAGGLVDELSIFIGPLVLGGKGNAFQSPQGRINQPGRTVLNTDSRRWGPDIMLRYLFN